MATPLTLPDHATCSTHQHYLLSCEDYEELLAESKGGCFICGFPAAKMPQKKLYIDHDGHEWAVRGLLCISCNSGLGDYRHPTPADADAYLANAWYLRKLAERGLSRNDPAPPVGSIVRDHLGIHWHHIADDRWLPFHSKQQDRTWDLMLSRCGRLNMRVVQTWDGRAFADLKLDPPAKRPPTKGALERRIAEALALLREREWCDTDREAVDALAAILAGDTPDTKRP